MNILHIAGHVKKKNIDLISSISPSMRKVKGVIILHIKFSILLFGQTRHILPIAPPRDTKGQPCTVYVEI